MRAIRAALAAALLAAAPALAQQSAQPEAMRGLRTAETALRDTLRQMDEGTVPPSMALSRLRQALNEVERAMLQLPSESRQGAPWSTAVKEVTEALAALRADGTEPAAARAEAGEALATLPALRGAETGSEGG
jgi:hypothetical protein